MSVWKKIRIFAYYIVFLFILFFVSELFLRCQPQLVKNKKHVEWLKTMMAYDEILGWRHVPNTQVLSESREYKVEYKINSKGLRDIERSYDKRDEQLRILCIGDSITFGWGIDAQQRFTNILESSFKNTEVINMGVQGYGIDQNLLFLRQEGVKYHPALVLMYVISPDFKRAYYSEMWGKQKPQFLLDDKEELLLSNVPVPKVRGFYLENPMLYWSRYYLCKKSYLFWVIQNKIDNLKMAKNYLANNRESLSSDKIGYSYWRQLDKTILKNIQITAALSNAKVVIVGSLSRSIKQFLRENNIYFCENPLVYYKGRRSDICYAEFSHPNALGNKLIAEGIYKYLVEQELIPKEHLLSDSQKGTVF